MANQTIEKELSCGNKFQTEVMKILGFGLHNKTILVIRDFISAKYYARKNRVIYLTDNTKLYEKFKNAVNNDLCGHDDNCILINNWKNKLQFNISKMLEKFNMPKFDVAIMNPPYDKNLHLKILEKIIPIADKVVNISPVGWLQCRYNTNTFVNIRTHIKNIEILPMVDAVRCFDAGFNCDLGIYELDNNVYDFSLLDKKVLNILAKTDAQDSLANHVEQNKRDGWRMQISEIQPITAQGGAKYSYGWYCKFCIYNHLRSTIYFDGMKNGKDWTEFNSGIKQPKGSGMQWSFHFNTEVEAVNFENSLATTFYHFIVLHTKWNQHTPFKYLPYMQDYTQPWTDKRFCEYFGITGYIDDEHAESNSEWEIILNAMKDFK